MRTNPARPVGSSGIRVMSCWVLWLLSGLMMSTGARLSEAVPIADTELLGKLRLLQETANDAARLRQACALAAAHRLSSHQVKAIARTLSGEESRIEFALAAYPSTVDPENFYEVYDAFESFSKVFRLHDQIARIRSQPRLPPAPPPPPEVAGPPPLAEAELADILKAIKRENFDDGRLTLARQIISSAKGRIASRQVGAILALFTFDDRRLDLAKSAYASVFDPWNYHLVYETFTFSSNRQALSEFIQAQARPR